MAYFHLNAESIPGETTVTGEMTVTGTGLTAIVGKIGTGWSDVDLGLEEYLGLLSHCSWRRGMATTTRVNISTHSDFCSSTINLNYFTTFSW